MTMLVKLDQSHNWRLRYHLQCPSGNITDPNGRRVPAAMVARSINVGTNLRSPTRFIDKAVRASRGPAEEAMRNTAEEILRKAGN